MFYGTQMLVKEKPLLWNRQEVLHTLWTPWGFIMHINQKRSLWELQEAGELL